MNWKLISAAVFGVGIAVSVVFVSRTPDAQVAVFAPPQSSSPSVRISEGEVASAFATTNRPIAETGNHPRQHLLEKYNSMRNGRSFVLDSWQHPEIGGRFYASTLVDFCASIATSIDLLDQAQPRLTQLASENHVNAIAAFDLLQAKCAQFTDDEYRIYSGRGLMGRKDEPDVLMKLVQQFFEARRSGSYDSRLLQTKNILDTADPLVISDINLSLSISKDDRGIYIYFDREKYYVNEDPPILAAYYLLPCGLGLACGATDLELALMCVTGSNCYTDRFDRVFKEMAGGDSKRNEEIVSMYRRILAAVNGRDAAKFVVP